MRTPHYPAAFRSRSEALSTQLGEAIVRAARRFSIPVHQYEPVRASVLRGGSRWVPAVLRYSLVPTAVLIEICNLNNDQDRHLLLTWQFRERLAHAIAAGLAEGFSR
jgi:N-acetylmuramoyl-L-alanine amidase